MATENTSAYGESSIPCIVLVEEKKAVFMKTLAERHHHLIYGSSDDAKSTKLRHPSNPKQDREFQRAVATLKGSFKPAAMMELNKMATY